MGVKLQDYWLGASGARDVEIERIAWAERRVRVIAMGQVAHGVPYHEQESGQGGSAFLLLPYAGQSEASIQAAADHLATNHAAAHIRVARIDANGFPLIAANAEYRVLLAVRGNPDHGQDPDRPPYGMPGDRVASASSIEAAQTLVRAFIDDHEVGGGNWVGGDVWHAGHRLGRISYNGRFHEAPGEFSAPVIEFRERMFPDSDRIFRRLRSAPDGNVAMDDIQDASLEPALPLAVFATERSADAWRIWYAAEVEANPALGRTTLSPAMDPVVCTYISGQEAHEPFTALDAHRIGAAFTRGDDVIPAIVCLRPQPTPSMAM